MNGGIEIVFNIGLPIVSINVLVKVALSVSLFSSRQEGRPVLGKNLSFIVTVRRWEVPFPKCSMGNDAHHIGVTFTSIKIDRLIGR